jgi:hypothetical protein
VIILEERALKNMAKTIVNLLDNKRQECGMCSINSSILGTSILKSAMKEVHKNLLASIETMNSMAEEGIIIRGCHYDITVDYDGLLILRFNYRFLYKSFEEYCKKHNTEHVVFTLKEFGILLKTAPYCREYNRPVWFSENVESYVNKKLFCSAILDVFKLQTSGAAINKLIERN